MANMTFGVNIIPYNNVPDGNNTYSLGNSNNKWNIYVNQVNGTTLTIPSGAAIATTDQIPSVPVTDVQVDGTSVLSSGVANIDMMGLSVVNGELCITYEEAST